MRDIQHATDGHEAKKQKTGPVEVDGAHVVRVGPEAPEEAPARVQQGKAVDRVAAAAEAPARGGQGLVAEAFERHAPDRDEVGGCLGDKDRGG